MNARTRIDVIAMRSVKILMVVIIVCARVDSLAQDALAEVKVTSKCNRAKLLFFTAQWQVIQRCVMVYGKTWSCSRNKFATPFQFCTCVST